MLVDAIYRGLLQPVLFRFDAERVHDRAIRFAGSAGALGPSRRLAEALFCREFPALATNVFGLRFPHPLGLAAGFDKSGRAIPFWEALGFSHIEIGSISAERSLGNPKPRLFRIPSDQGIVVNYGLPNDGADAVAQRLANTALRVPLGVNLVNTNRGPGAPPETEEAIIGDYLTSLRRLEPYANYLVLNLSCPNTPDGCAFVSNAGRLRRMLAAVDDLRPMRPVLLKVAPFPDLAAMDAFLDAVAQVRFVSGFAVNLPPGKPPGLTTPAGRLRSMPGAVSGKPAEAAINQTLRDLYTRMDRKRYKLVAAGGIFTAQDAYRKIRLGASLVQLLTAMVFRGPGVVRQICEDLCGMLARDGYRSAAEAVGADHEI
ncbi:MAG: quinone-dependent dihydroorotate dehydrogenase [Bryobacteraceae bacterium]|nr:quinone-dependent dihydroorotate dehydrogenase [Bryobacteraceae bacterium]